MPSIEAVHGDWSWHTLKALESLILGMVSLDLHAGQTAVPAQDLHKGSQGNTAACCKSVSSMDV